MAWRSALRAGGAVGLAVLVAGSFPSVAGAAPKVAFSITDKRITEASGMARDTQAALYWVVNDSGSSGVAYGVGPNGKVRGTLNFRAQPKDIEAVALHDDRLYVADIGDNDKKRRDVTVYYFDAPRASGLTVAYRSWDFRYPDGAHDAETLLVTPKGQMYVVTKAAEAGFYRAPDKPSRTAANKLTRVNDAPAMVTDGVVLPGGRQIALLTYTRVVVVDAESGAEVASTPLTGPRQAESIALSLDGRSLLVGSEGSRSKVYEMPVPGAASASPSPSGSPADSGADDPVEDEAAPAKSRRGTLLAVGVAGLVAVVAGVVAGVARRP